MAFKGTLKYKCKISDLFTFNCRLFDFGPIFTRKKTWKFNLVWFWTKENSTSKFTYLLYYFAYEMSNNKRANKQEKKRDKNKVINPKYYKHRKGSAKNTLGSIKIGLVSGRHALHQVILKMGQNICKACVLVQGDHLTLFQPGEQIMPTTLLLGTRNSKILRQALICQVFIKVSRSQSKIVGP